MRLLLISPYHSPEWTGIGKYTGEMATWLAAHGDEVRVVTTPPHYPHWRVQPGYSAWRYQREQIGSICVVRCPVWVPKRPNAWRRMVYSGSFAASSAPAILAQIRWKPELIFVVEPSLLCVPISMILARITGARLWLHVQDFEIDAGFALLGNRATPNWALRIETTAMRRFDRVSTISRKMRSSLVTKGIAPGATELLPNWADLEELKPEPTLGRDFRKQIGIPPDCSVVLYAGSMGVKQGLETIAELVHAVSDIPELYFVFCGEGVARARLEAVLSGQPRVRFLPLQPPERLNALLNCADVHLLPQRAGAADLVMPSKLGGMLACGGAVLAGAAPGTELDEVVRASGGQTVTPESVPEFSAALRMLTQNPAVRARAGRKARAYAERNFEIGAILRRFQATARNLGSHGDSVVLNQNVCITNSHFTDADGAGGAQETIT